AVTVRRQQTFEQVLDEMTVNPALDRSTKPREDIGRALDVTRTEAQLDRQKVSLSQADLDDLYKKFLIQTALERARAKDPSSLNFDLQGTLFCFLDLKPEDFKGFLVAHRLVRQDSDPQTAQSTLEKLLGTKVTNPIECNLDVKGTALEGAFKQ